MNSQIDTELHVGAPYMNVRRLEHGVIEFEWSGPELYEEIFFVASKHLFMTERGVFIHLKTPCRRGRVHIHGMLLYFTKKCNAPIVAIHVAPIAGATARNMNELQMNLDSYRTRLYTWETGFRAHQTKHSRPLPQVHVQPPPQAPQSEPVNGASTNGHGFRHLAKMCIEPATRVVLNLVLIRTLLSWPIINGTKNGGQLAELPVRKRVNRPYKVRLFTSRSKKFCPRNLPKNKAEKELPKATITRQKKSRPQIYLRELFEQRHP